MRNIIFWLNGERQVLTTEDPTASLSSYLHGQGLTGTKVCCSEGGCGACTVLLSDTHQGQVRHRAVLSCLLPLVSLHHTAVTTVEALGSAKRNQLHPIQRRLVEFHGSQCGKCTPGIVMSLFAFLLNNPQATVAQIEHSFDCNLCRCTGYRPILDAAKSFAVDFEDWYENDVKSSVEDMGVSVKARKQRYGPIQKLELPYPFPSELFEAQESVLATGICHARKNEEVTVFQPANLEALRNMDKLVEDGLVTPEMLSAAKIYAGSTEVGIERNTQNKTHRFLISVGRIAELSRIEETDNGLVIGAGSTLSELVSFIEGMETSKRPSILSALLKQLRVFASAHVRNVATLAGNVVNASPISDTLPVLMAAGATWEAIGARSGEKRQGSVEELIVGYRRTSLQPLEILSTITIPFNMGSVCDAYFRADKIARRFEDDISIVNMCSGFTFDIPQNAHPIIKDVRIFFGGMAATTKRASMVESVLRGRTVDREVIDAMLEKLGEEFALPVDVPGLMSDYRVTVAGSILFKAFVSAFSEMCEKHQVADLPTSLLAMGREEVADLSTDSTKDIRLHQVSRGAQVYEGVDINPLGEPEVVEPDSFESSALHKSTPHATAHLQAAGEAEFVSNMTPPTGTLYAALVTCPYPHARVLSIDTSNAKKYPGVRHIITAEDIQGRNGVGVAVKDEQILVPVGGDCVYRGHPVAMVLADTRVHALAAAADPECVRIEYEEKRAVATVYDAKKEHEFKATHGVRRGISRGNLEDGWKKAIHIVEGSLATGAQEHFYLETQCAVAEPLEDEEIRIYASTQHPSGCQGDVAAVLGCLSNKIEVIVRRCGGAFGGKESNMIYPALTALATTVSGRPTSLHLPRQLDMISTGKRHPVIGHYRMGCDASGSIVAYELELELNSGHSVDLTLSVAERAMLHADAAYYIPNIAVHATGYRTNIATNTAFRGFGAPQALVITETAVTKLARKIGIAETAFRAQNFYSEERGTRTHFDQHVKQVDRLSRAFNQIMEKAKYNEREAAIAAFNTEHKYRKRGIAVTPLKFGISFTQAFLNQASAQVHVYKDGSVLVHHAGIEMGQGVHTKMMQIAAATLGVPYNLVHVRGMSTYAIANSSPTSATTAADLNGMAVQDACLQIRDRLLPFRQNMKDKSWAEICNAAWFNRTNLSATGWYKTPISGFNWETGTGEPFSYFSYGAAVSEVEIDTLTGEYTQLRADIVFDAGKSLNPAIDIGQIEGSWVQGAGWLTTEEWVELKKLNKEGKLASTGIFLSNGPGTYKIPGALDVPLDMRVELLDNAANEYAIAMSKGVGEPPFCLAQAVYFALRNAVEAARVENKVEGDFDLMVPATCEAVRIACGKDYVAEHLFKGRVPVTTQEQSVL